MREHRAVCGGFILTHSAPTAGTAVSWAPGTLCGLGAEDGPQRQRGPPGGGKATRCGGIATRLNFTLEER